MKMKTFNQMRQSLSEGKAKLGSGEKAVKSFKVGKNNKYEAIVAKKGNIFSAYVDGDHLDDYVSVSKAEKGIKDFIRLAGK